jgi:hypothetical protein
LPHRAASTAAAVLAAFILPAVALSRPITKPKTVNLDGDPALEQVIPQEVCEAPAGGATAAVCGPDQFAQRRIVIEDTCNGVPYSRVVSTEQEAVIKLVVSNFEDLTPRPEIFFDLRSGAAARVGEIGIVSWEDGATAADCPVARTLFRYPSKRTSGRLPRRAKAVSSFDAVLRDRSKRFGGKELRLTEFYVDRNDPLCCASFRRVTWFGYSAGRDLYVRFKTRLSRIRR